MSSGMSAQQRVANRKKYAQRLREAQIEALYSRMPLALLIELLLATGVIVLILSDITTFNVQVRWLAAHLAANVMMAYLYLTHRRTFGQSKSNSFASQFVIGVFFLGSYWGSLLAFTYSTSTDIAFHAYVFLLMGCIGALAVSILSDHLPAFIAFFAPPAVLVCGMSIVLVESNHILLCMFGALSVASLVLLAKSKNSDLVESLTLRFAMADLTEELSEQRDAANRANVAKSKFLAAASHDLRQPLHALTLLTSALESSTSMQGVREIAGNIQGTVGSLDKLFNALLDISRLDAGVLRPQLQHFALDPQLSRVSGEYALEAESKRITLTYEPCAFVAHSDPLLLERILRNYLANAVRYTSAGHIRLTCKRIAEGLRIEVADTGIGILPSQQVEIFDEFFQLDNPERDRAKGLGLGLAIVRRVAELLGHVIAVESNPGQGARFSVIVPEGRADQVAHEAKLDDDPRERLAGLRVVVIDDDGIVRESMRTLLALWGCQLVIAADEDEAVIAAREQFGSPDILLVDYRLRGGRTGVQAVARLHQEFSIKIPALILSGDTAPERLREVAESGHLMLHKPVQPAVLRGFLLRALRASRT